MVRHKTCNPFFFHQGCLSFCWNLLCLHQLLDQLLLLSECPLSFRIGLLSRCIFALFCPLLMVFAVVLKVVGKADEAILLNGDFKDVILKGGGGRQKHLPKEALSHAILNCQLVRLGHLFFLAQQSHLVLKVFQNRCLVCPLALSVEVKDLLPQCEVVDQQKYPFHLFFFYNLIFALLLILFYSYC